jgi:hypothetical protein
MTRFTPKCQLVQSLRAWWLIRACVLEWGELRVAVSIASRDLGITRLTKAAVPSVHR